jgi:hypothetical protein
MKEGCTNDTCASTVLLVAAQPYQYSTIASACNVRMNFDNAMRHQRAAIEDWMHGCSGERFVWYCNATVMTAYY